MAHLELKEIKKNHTGHGLLIDNDGYISLNEGKNRQLKESFDSSSEWHCPYPFKVNAVFQKSDTKNANGRVYPRNVLEKQIEAYQEKIAERRALGECYQPDALVLCEEGWKTMEEVQVGDKVLTLNTETNEIEIQPIYEKIEKDFDGEMVRIFNMNIDDIVTPNHEYILFDDKTNKYVKNITANEILNGYRNAHEYIPRKGFWKGEKTEYMTIPNLPEDKIEKMHSYNQLKYSGDLNIPMKLFARFMGIYLSEGYCDKQEDGTRVCISQKKEKNVDKINDLLNEIGLPFSKEIRTTEDGSFTYTFVICDMRLCAYLQQFGLCYDKFVPVELKKQNGGVLSEFYDWFVMGDGRIRTSKNRKPENATDDVFSTSKQLVLDLNEIQLKIGYCGNYHVEARNNDRYIGNRLIEGKNTQPLHFSLRSTTKNGVHLDKDHLKAETVSYKGKVMCIKVENHNFYVMCNNKTQGADSYGQHLA